MNESVAEIPRNSIRRSTLHQVQSEQRTLGNLSPSEREAYERLADEIRADADLLSDPRYAQMISYLERTFSRRRLGAVVFHPERVVKVSYPLYANEVAQLLAELGLSVQGKTIERWVERGLVPTPQSIGSGALPRNAYFARHVIDILFLKQVLAANDTMEAIAAELRVLTGALAEEDAVYFRGLPAVNPAMLKRASTRGRVDGRGTQKERRLASG